jgi:hypothetical protein
METPVERQPRGLPANGTKTINVAFGNGDSITASVVAPWDSMPAEWVADVQRELGDALVKVASRLSYQEWVAEQAA